MKTLTGFDAIYCDASFFVALFSKKDTEHQRAIELFEEIKEQEVSIFTCWSIISEAMTVLLYRYGYSEARIFGQSIHLYRTLNCKESHYHQAIALFNLFSKNRKISFVDALSYVLITGQLKNIPAISFDSDFRSMGLTTIS